MSPKSVFFKALFVFVLMTLALNVVCGVPARAMQTSPDAAPPAGLSAEDWSQIQDFLRAALPGQQAYLKASNAAGYDLFGYSVAISGDTVVVGAKQEDSSATGVNGNQKDNSVNNSGAAYVFTRRGATWSQQAYLKASNTGADDGFGTSLAIDGDTVVISAVGEDSNATGVNGNQDDNSALNSGAVYVFTRNGMTWRQQAYLKASNTGADDGFGTSVSISGDTLVVGAKQEDSSATGVNGDQSDNSELNSGAAYVFTRSGATWDQQAYLKASNAEGGDFIPGYTIPGDYFGYSVAISGDTAVVSAYYEDSSATGVDGNQNDNSVTNSGAAYVFNRTGTTWSQQAYLKAFNTGEGDIFGTSLDIFGDTVVVGAIGEDSNATGTNGNQDDNSARESGAAYVFTRNGAIWSQQAYLKASNTETSDYFGSSLAISVDTLVVGANGEDSSATGVNGNQNNNSTSRSGAAYIFTRIATTWSQQVYMKASNPDQADCFGNTVGVSGDTVVVGVYWEDSNATGVDGDQNDNSAKNTGAGYVFKQLYAPLLKSVGAYDGHILELGENMNVGGTLDSNSTTFNLGDELGDRQYRAILSFNTSTLPDNAIITKVILKIKKQGQVGTNPFTILGGLKVDIRKPFFGTTPGLVLSDFQAAAGKSAAATFSATPVANWYSAVIGSGSYSHINKIGTTQFRLRFVTDDNDDGNADYMKFYSGNYANAAFRPILVVAYYLP